MKLVYIEWLDHCSFGSGCWNTKESCENMEPILAKTIGWLVKETDEHLVVVSTTLSDNYYGGDSLILKSCIKKRKNVRI